MKRVILLVALLPAVLMIGCSNSRIKANAVPVVQQSTVMTDAAITTQVKSAIATDIDLAPAKIAVETVAGTVTLKGEIKSLLLRKRIDALVEAVDGVKAVNNRLVITG